MTNKIEISGRSMDVKDRLRDYVEKKAAKLERYLPLVDDIRIELEYNKAVRSAKSRYIAQITARGKGMLLRVEERADDIRPAFDEALDKIQRQMERYKGKHYHNRGDGKSAADLIVEEPAPLEKPGKKAEVTRRKKFVIDPMSEAEALVQMKMIGHDDFYVFFNTDTESIGILYRRRDGTYGVIEPIVR
jgi:putative sigma-54 modulation protein